MLQVHDWTTIIVVLLITALLGGAVSIAPLNNNFKRWLGAGAFVVAAVYFAYRFLR